MGVPLTVTDRANKEKSGNVPWELCTAGVMDTK